MTKAKHRITAWIASFAVLLAALAPSISHAINAANDSGSGWIEICSTVGSKLAKVDGAQNPASQAPADKAIHFEHCPFCFTHAGSVGLPPSTDLTLPIASNALPLPSLFYQSPRPLFLWAAAQSRAPPFNS
ncbi:MAG: DUF2946 domain-containing protein [Burkholderiaceae bacterium]